MADPVSIGLAAAGAGVTAFGINEKADAMTNMYNYKAGVAQANAAYAEANAKYATGEGQIKEQQFGLAEGQKLSQMKVDQGASGLLLGSGSAGRTVTSEIAGIQEGEGIISYEAAKKAYGYSIQAADFKNEAEFDVMAGKQAQSAKWYDIGSSLLSGGTGGADKWVQYSKAGVFA